jgi:PAS domain S-box-containing protein
MNQNTDKRQQNIINVLLIGGGKGGSGILRELLLLDNVKVLGLAELKPEAPGCSLADSHGIPVWQDYKKMLQMPNYDIVIEATGVLDIYKEIEKVKAPKACLIVAEAALLMMRIIERHTELRDQEMDVERLSAIMDAAQEGIEMADNDGTIRYVNQAFSWITKVKKEDRIGRNVFDISPDGALAEVLKTKKPVFGKLNHVMKTNVEVLSNASPLIVHGKMQGAVVLFRDVSDIRKMGQRLGESREVIRNLQEEIRQLAKAHYSFDDIIGRSQKMVKQIQIARQAAKDASTILVTGESGTGKELLSHALHAAGPRCDGPFVKVDCASIPTNLLESILFGYEKGAFTGAIKSKMGKFELADGGTIFLDEIGELDIGLQAKFLRVLQEREVERIGGSYPIKVDVRVIAATNRNLLEAVHQGRFRQDLFYRLNVINLELPPLRERRDDIPLIAQSILNKKNNQYNKECVISADVISLFQEYSWPGNVREMENVIERAVLLSETGLIPVELVQTFLEGGRQANDKIGRTLRQIEAQAIQEALNHWGWSLEGKKKAAQSLGISLATLYNKLERYSLKNLE